jgi:hypothetical protein
LKRPETPKFSVALDPTLVSFGFACTNHLHHREGGTKYVWFFAQFRCSGADHCQMPLLENERSLVLITPSSSADPALVEIDI